jgi:hypothetical protein
LIDPFGNQPICADFIGGAQTKWLMKRVIRRRRAMRERRSVNSEAAF